MNYEEAKKLCVEYLAAAASAHEAKRYSKIKLGYDHLDGVLPREAGPEFNKLTLALTFWDGWIDAQNHDWDYYPYISKNEWPRLARQIIQDINNDVDITHPQILKQFCAFPPDNKSGLLWRICNFFRGKHEG